MLSRAARSARSVLVGGRWLAALAVLALVVLPGTARASDGAGKPVITFGSPSPSEGATLTSGSAQFAFTFNRTPKQTEAVTCTLSSPTTTSTGNCNPLAAAPGGSGSGASYSNLAKGSYAFTVTVTLTDGGTVSAVRDFTVAVPLPQVADLSITNTDSTGGYVVAGGTTNYTIVVTNNGPSDVNGATVTDNLLPAVASDSWTVTNQTGGATTTPLSGTADINEIVNMPSGSSITFVVTAGIGPAATGTIATTATVTPPTGITDPNPNNNAATDTVTVSS